VREEGRVEESSRTTPAPASEVSEVLEVAEVFTEYEACYQGSLLPLPWSLEWVDHLVSSTSLIQL
jgi:hypothetical protein